VALSPAEALNGSGQATYTTTALALGSTVVFAVFSATDATSFSASSSTTVTQVVHQATTTLLLTSAPNPSTFGQPVTISAQISPAPGPTGTVTFYLGTPSGSHSVLGTASLNAQGKATLITSSLPPGTDSLYGVYGGDSNYVGSTSPVISQMVGFPNACINGTINGGYVVKSDTAICITGKVNGGITVQARGALFLNGAVLNGGLTASGSTGLRFCGSTLNGAITITGSTGSIMIGDGGDEGPPGCAGNSINTTTLTLANNTGGLELAGNNMTGLVTLSGNTGVGPTAEDSSPEVEGNSIVGTLSCSTSNTPAITDGGQHNTITGLKSGQCAAASF
jgi:hypothetical protein